MSRTKLPSGMFGSETELCAQLIDVARAAGYQAHPEVGNWDVLLVCRETGDQVGVQAKLRPSVDVLAQALTDERHPGPEVHAVLVPTASRAFLSVARTSRVHVFQGVHLGSLDMPTVLARAQRWQHRVREWAPEVEIRFPAGVPSPKRVTPWKMSAVKLCLLARSRGYVTRKDLTELKLDPTWWFNPKFGPVLTPRLVEREGGSEVRRGEYVLHDSSSPMVPDLRWPEVVDALQRRERETAPRVGEQPIRKGPRERRRRTTAGNPPPSPGELVHVAEYVPGSLKPPALPTITVSAKDKRAGARN